MKLIITYLFMFFAAHLYAQDTAVYETVTTENYEIKHFKQEYFVKDVLIKTIQPWGNQEVLITTHSYKKDTEFVDWVILMPHFPDSVTESDFIAMRIDRTDTNFYGENRVAYPCPCLLKRYPAKYFSVKKIFTCKLDTVRKVKYISVSSKNGQVKTHYDVKDGKYKWSSSQYYTKSGNWQGEETPCTIFTVEYDSLENKKKRKLYLHLRGFPV